MEGKKIDSRPFRTTILPKCPRCGGGAKKNGHEKNGAQRFRCSECQCTFTGRSGTIIFSSKLGPTQIKRLISMLLDGTALMQACHQANVLQRTAILYQRKLQHLMHSDETKVLSGTVWVDECYINVSIDGVEFSEKESKDGKPKLKAGLSGNKHTIFCGSDSSKRCFAIISGKGKSSTDECEKVYGPRVAPGSQVIHDQSDYGNAFKDCEVLAVNSKSEGAHAQLNEINRFINTVQRCFKIYLRVRRRNIRKYLNVICFMYENRLKNFDDLVAYVYERIFSSGKTLRRIDVSDN